MSDRECISKLLKKLLLPKYSHLINNDIVDNVQSAYKRITVVKLLY